MGFGRTGNYTDKENKLKNMIFERNSLYVLIYFSFFSERERRGRGNACIFANLLTYNHEDYYDLTILYKHHFLNQPQQVLFSMWGHQELREVYKKAGWKEQDFVSKSVAARNAAGGGANSPTANNTLNRPMASQGGTRYEDRTIQRGQGKAHHQYNRVSD